MAVQTIPNPKGQTINITVEAGEGIRLDFESGGGLGYVRPVNSPDLVITFEDGGQITLGNFFAVPDEASLPTLAFIDAPSPRPAAEILAALGIDPTPTGLATPPTPNQGTSDADVTIPAGPDGLEGSDDQDSFYWASASGTPDEMNTGLSTLGDDASGPFYDARAVFYEPNPSTATDFKFKMALQDGSIGRDAEVLSSENGYVNIATMTYDATNDCYTASLTPEGIAAMKAGSEQLYDYIKVEGPDGTLYTVQVVLNQDGKFDSTSENAKNKPDGNFKGEWHTQITDSVNLDTSSRNNDDVGDRVWLSGMTADDHNNRVITNAGADTVNVENGMLASLGSSNTIDTGKTAGDSITIGDNVVAALGDNTLISGAINIKARTADAALIAKGAVNTLDASGDITLDVKVKGNDAAGVLAAKYREVGSNSIKSDDGDVRITVGSDGSNETSGVKATGGSFNTITADLLDINVTAKNVPNGPTDGETSANGLNSVDNDSINSITVDYGAEITVGTDAAKNASGLRTVSGTNTVTATNGNLDVEVANETGAAMGMYAGLSSSEQANYNGINLLDAQNGGVNLSVSGDSQSSGMQAVHAGYADASGARSAGNYINAGGGADGDVSISAGHSASKTSYGMNAVDSGYNSITATDTVNITAEASRTAYGMRAMNGNTTEGDSLNEIHAHTVSVSAEAVEKGGKAYAMQARSDGSNEIHGVEVTLSATNMDATGFAMYAADKGINLVQLSAEGTVTLNGDVYQADSGENKLLGSDGNDTFIIDGKVLGANALFINGGEGQADKLVLMAANKTEFLERYEDWLSNPDNIKGIEVVEVRYSDQDISLSDFTDLQDLFQNIPGADFIYSLGDGEHVLTIDNASFDFTGDFHLQGGLGMDTLNLGEVSGTYTLADIANMIDGFEVLDLGGFPGKDLTITIGDASLDDLGLTPNGEQYETLLSGYFAKDATILRISGDAGDMVTADQATWESYTPKNAGNSYCVIDGITYNMYYNTEDSNQFLLIQNEIMGI